MSPGVAGAWLLRIAATLLFAAAIASSFLLLSWTSLARLLDADARSRMAAFETAGGRVRWDFADPRAIVLPGSRGVESALRDPNSGMRWVHVDPDVDLPLRLPRPALALQAVRTATLRIEVDAAARVGLWAHDRSGQAHPGPEVRLDPGLVRAAVLPLPRLPEGESATALRLHVHAAPGTRVRIERLDLLPLNTGPVPHCEMLGSVTSTLSSCGLGPVRVVSGRDTSPERWLAGRDALEAASLAFVVPAGAATPETPGGSAARPAALLGWTTGIGGALALALLAWQIHAARRGRAMQPVWALLLLVPPMLLLWHGVPAEDDAEGLRALGLLLLLPLLFSRRDPEWRWLGDGAAWSATVRVTVLALAVIAMLALANALDADGFQTRWPDLDKLWIYPAWAVFQQFLLIEFIAPRTRRLARGPIAGAILAGTCFGLLHLPNFALMLLTALAGSVWAGLGYRHRALLPLAVSHALLGAIAVAVAPVWLLRSAEIGARYLMPP